MTLGFGLESDASDHKGHHGGQTPNVIPGSRVGLHKVKGKRRHQCGLGRGGGSDEQVQRNRENGTHLCRVGMGEERLWDEAHNRSHYDGVLVKRQSSDDLHFLWCLCTQLYLESTFIRCLWIQWVVPGGLSRDPRYIHQGFHCTFEMMGSSLQVTWTSPGSRPISSWASLKAVCTSSLSLGSRLPPGKHTSPAPTLSCTQVS